MKKIPLLALLAAVPVLLASCDWLLTPPPKKIETGNFYANDFTKSGLNFYTVKASILYEGEHCVVWAETAANVKLEQAQEIANEYDTKIYKMLIDKFSMKDFSLTGQDQDFKDMLAFANWMAGNKHNGKLTILLLDIKDGFKDPETDFYVAGYFWRGNFFNTNGSNGRDMIYIDTYPALSEQTKEAYSTLAHEAQHLVNYATTRYMMLKGEGRSTFMDTWIDEGLAMQAEYFYLNKNLENRCEWFSNDPEGTIEKGNNFFVWDNHSGNSILDDYATAYLFFRWLNLQEAGEAQSSMFMNIITSEFSDYRAVTNVAKNISNDYSNWEPLLRTWLAANYYPGNATYGYKGDSYLMTSGTRKDKNNNTVITGVKATPVGGTTISLYPGEGVYSLTPTSSNLADGTGDNSHIRYAGLNSGTITTSGTGYSGEALITYNANTQGKTGETGNLTGVPVKASVQGGRAASGQRFFDGPYRVDARDLMGRNNW